MKKVLFLFFSIFLSAIPSIGYAAELCPGEPCYFGLGSCARCNYCVKLFNFTNIGMYCMPCIGPAETDVSGGYVESVYCCDKGELKKIPSPICNGTVGAPTYTKITYYCSVTAGLTHSDQMSYACSSGEVFTGDRTCQRACGTLRAPSVVVPPVTPPVPPTTSSTTSTTSTTTTTILTSINPPLAASCSNHAQCSQTCSNVCPSNVYGCCYGCKLGQCVNGKCGCVDATSYCSGSPAYQVGARCQAANVTPVSPVTSCTNHAQCSKACSASCPSNVYGCCYGCKIGQCISGKCGCINATSYCSGNPAYQVGARCQAPVTVGGVLWNLWELTKNILGIRLP